MINFFRKIRYDLLEKNKTGKPAWQAGRYLTYAIGEVALVVIGILIALQINNWNENRKTDNIRYIYFQQLLDDIDNEINYINSLKGVLDNSIESYERYQEFIKDPNLEPSDIIKELVKLDFSFRILTFNSKTTEVLESTGDIKLIPKDIRNKLIDIKRWQEALVLHQKTNEGGYLADLKKASSLGLPRLKKPESFQNINVHENVTEIILILESAFQLKNTTEKIRLETLEDMSEDLEELKSMVETKLNL